MRNVLRKELGIELRNMRQQCGFSQQEVADRLGVGRTTISGYEIGKRGIEIDLFFRYCDICHTDPYQLLENVRKYVYKK